MIAANDNWMPLTPAIKAILAERVLEEFDLLSLGIPTPERLEREIEILHHRLH